MVLILLVIGHLGQTGEQSSSLLNGDSKGRLVPGWAKTGACAGPFLVSAR